MHLSSCKPAVSAERIVWTDIRNGTMDIYMYDPFGGRANPFVLLREIRTWLPLTGYHCMAGWEERKPGIYICLTFPPCRNQWLQLVQSKPELARGVASKYVVYADDRSGNWNIYLYDIAQQQEIAICTNTSDQTYPVISGGPHLWDLTISYMDERSGKKYLYLLPVFSVLPDLNGSYH